MPPRLTLKMAVASLLPLFVVAHLGHHLLTAVTSPLLPLIRTGFGLSYEQTGLMLSAYTLAYGAGHLASGWLMALVGPRLLILAGIAGVAASGLAIGLAPTFGFMLAFQFLMGIVGSGYHPAATTLISRSVPAEMRGQALGVHVIGGSSSFFITPLLAGLIAPVWGWRGAFVALAIPTIALGVVIFVLLGRGESRADRAAAQAQDRTDTAGAPWALIIPLLALSCVGAALVGSAISFLPLLATDTHKVSPEIAAIVVAVVNSPGVYVGPFAGLLSDRLGRVPLLIGVTLATAVTVTLVARVPYGVVFYVLVVLVGAYPFVRMPISESFILGEVPAKHRSNVLGFYYFASSALAAVINPVVGKLTDTHGFGVSFAALGAAFVVLAAACAVAFRFTERSRSATARGPARGRT